MRLSNNLDDIILIAVPEEAPAIMLWDNVFFTGIGKINATYTVTHLLHHYKPKRVWNFGTAGGVTCDSGLYQIGSVVQTDMYAPALGIPRCKTPQDLCPAIISLNQTGFICGTADEFTEDPGMLAKYCDVVDMEAYAIAKAVWRYNLDKGTDVSVYCWKYVSNKVAHGGGLDWQQNINIGQELYKQKYKEFHELIPNSGLLH